jgi:hypothetical protein
VIARRVAPDRGSVTFKPRRALLQPSPPHTSLPRSWFTKCHNFRSLFEPLLLWNGQRPCSSGAALSHLCEVSSKHTVPDLRSRCRQRRTIHTCRHYVSPLCAASNVVSLSTHGRRVGCWLHHCRVDVTDVYVNERPLAGPLMLAQWCTCSAWPRSH